MWSEREIICFSVLMLLVMMVVVYGIWKEKWNPVQGVAIIVLVLFLGIVFGSTVFTRTTAIRQYELKPFWFWCAVIRYHVNILVARNRKSGNLEIGVPVLGNRLFCAWLLVHFYGDISQGLAASAVRSSLY